MTGPSAETNFRTYDAPEVAAHYAALDYLTPCERLLFETYVKPGSAVLDLGVGGGRTTSYLAPRASRYVGVDYAPAMVKACQAKFPALEFVVEDAADLSVFTDSAFDAVVFAFNGIDYVLPEQARRRCLEHIRRVLKPGGVLIFSSHNARAIVERPLWNRERLRWAARRLSGGSKALCGLLFSAFTLARWILAVVQAAWRTLLRLARRVPSHVFWSGEGNLVDSAHGGLLTHCWTPTRVVAELQTSGFRPQRILADVYARTSHRFSTDWYYYVFAKPCDR